MSGGYAGAKRSAVSVSYANVVSAELDRESASQALVPRQMTAAGGGTRSFQYATRAA
jgi:hypothetical protein